jgi:hypothetical protein
MSAGVPTARFGYQYIVLRCVPRTDREEFINVGVVLYSQHADYLCSASHLNLARLNALATELEVESVRAALAAIQSICCGETAMAQAGLATLGQRFGWLAAPKSTVVQPGPVHGGVTSDPERQLEHLLEALVQ